MSLVIITPIDGRSMARTVTKNMQNFGNTVVSMSLDEAISQRQLLTNSVIVLLLTPVMFTDINKKKSDDIGLLLANPERLVVIKSCEGNMTAMLTKKNINGSMLNQYDVMDEEQEQWFIAVARVNALMNKLHNRKVEVPTVNKYMINPECTVKGRNEVLIILFDDYQHSKQVQVQSDSHNVKICAKKMRTGVWSFNTEDLTPGVHTLAVCVDDIDIGTTTLIVQSSLDTLTTSLAKVTQEQPMQFLAMVMGMEHEKADFDLQLEDMLRSSPSDGSFPFFKLIEGLLQIGESSNEGHTFPTFLHFCAKYGLIETSKWILQNTPHGRTNCTIENRDNKTPYMMAVEAKHARLARILQDPDGDEVFEELVSPLDPKESFQLEFSDNPPTAPKDSTLKRGVEVKHRLSSPSSQNLDFRRDSGNSSGGSFEKSDNSSELSRTRGRTISDERQSIKLANTKTSTGGEKYNKGYQFSVREHPYNEIEDVILRPNQKEDPYSKPWDTESLPEGPLPIPSNMFLKQTSSQQSARFVRRSGSAGNVLTKQGTTLSASKSVNLGRIVDKPKMRSTSITKL